MSRDDLTYFCCLCGEAMVGEGHKCVDKDAEITRLRAELTAARARCTDYCEGAVMTMLKAMEAMVTLDGAPKQARERKAIDAIKEWLEGENPGKAEAAKEDGR